MINYTDFEKYFSKHPDINGIDNCLNYLAQFKNDFEIQDIIREIQHDVNF